MTIEAAILQNVAQLPEAVKQSVLIYTEFLAHHYRAKPEPVEGNQRPGETLGYGSLAGQIMMSDDFDAPLADLQDYM